MRVQRAPGAPQGGVVAACLDAQRVVFAPETNLLGVAQTLFKVPSEVRIIPRHARPSPSGRWLYAALETGGRNVRFDMDGFATGLQLVDADQDGVQDLVVYNSAALPKKMGVEIIYGPLWEQAQPHMPQKEAKK